MYFKIRKRKKIEFCRGSHNENDDGENESEDYPEKGFPKMRDIISENQCIGQTLMITQNLYYWFDSFLELFHLLNVKIRKKCTGFMCKYVCPASYSNK